MVILISSTAKASSNGALFVTIVVLRMASSSSVKGKTRAASNSSDDMLPKSKSRFVGSILAFLAAEGGEEGEVASAGRFLLCDLHAVCILLASLASDSIVSRSCSSVDAI